jgi:preprotein translocase subunit SecG
MMGIIIVIHVIVCALMIGSILMQSSKGGGMAGVFGGGGGVGGVFGGRGAASFLSKVTMWLGVIFALTTVSIALQEVSEKEKTTSPAGMLPTVPQSEPAQPEK